VSDGSVEIQTTRKVYRGESTQLLYLAGRALRGLYADRRRDDCSEWEATSKYFDVLDAIEKWNDYPTSEYFW
jgi:hypothetical protein